MRSAPKGLWALAAIHFAQFVYIALFKPMAFLLDDAFYSLTVAANIANGQGITYGGFPTNGFQPLYTFVATPVFALIGDHRMLCLRMALIFLGLCSAASLFVLYRIANKTAGPAAAMLAVFMVALSTSLLSHSASGLETALHGLLFLVTVCFYLEKSANLNLKSAVALGGLLALLAYARLDACFVFIAVATHRMIIHRHKPLLGVQENLFIFIPAMVLLAPWFLWNESTFGTVTQSSGAFHHWQGITGQQVSYALPGVAVVAAIKLGSLAFKLPLEPLMGYEALILSPVKMLGGVGKLHKNFLIQLWQSHPIAAVALGLGLILGAVLVIYFGREGVRRVLALRPLAWLLIALLCAGIYYPLYLLNYSMRHFYPYSLIMAIPVAAFLCGLLNIPRDGPLLGSKTKAVIFAVMAIALFRCGAANPQLPTGNPYGFDRIADIRSALPKGASIGYTDCGFYGYFLPEYTVVNLDGIMNFEALQAMKENRMSGYLLKNKVEYLLYLHNFTDMFKHQFDTDILSVIEPVAGSDFIFRVKAPPSSF